MVDFGLLHEIGEVSLHRAAMSRSRLPPRGWCDVRREIQLVSGDLGSPTCGDTVEQPIVAVGKRVAPKLYLETRYHHNAPMGENRAELHLQYEIKAPSWSVETFIGDAAMGGVELWWRKRFGRPRAPKEKRPRKVAGPAAGGSTTPP